ncbi:tRNA lysidine(34) synthetase TilS [Ornithinibacillus xuwenensis]|uniref:tRNA(Ile)-lysidine synthase n=1 Tax=Ornithinibacillus xuwenensis TaxID=3144668 RepID=A0ABU9XEL9_9BACI
MKEAVMDFIQKHNLLRPNATVLVAVSGGPDSMALLHFLMTIREEWKLKLIALSVDHQLRGEESKQDLEYVEQVCRQWNIRFIGASIDVPSYKKSEQLGTQIAARRLRYNFFEKQMHIEQADYLAFGHHGDDQTETMLMRLVRTADSSSFSGIPIKREFANGKIIRPFLCVTKQDLQRYCEKYGINPRIDPSNEATDYTRNYFRKKVLPLLKEKNSNIHTTIQYLSETLQADQNYMEAEAKKMAKNVVEFQGNPKSAQFDIEQFQSHASALQRRAFHLILNYLYDGLPENLSYIHEEHFFSLLANDKSNVQIDFPRHLKVEKAYNKLILYFQTDEHKMLEYHEVLSVPGKVILPDGAVVTATYSNEVKTQSNHTYICLASHVALPLHVRTRREGDRMSWNGLKGSKKVKDIFIDLKIPLQDRNSWPIVTDNKGEILWLVGLKKRDPIPSDQGTSYLQLYYDQGNV